MTLFSPTARSEPLSARPVVRGLVVRGLVVAMLAISSTANTARAEGEWSVISIIEVPVEKGSASIAMKDVPGRFRAFRVRSTDSRYLITGAKATYADGSSKKDQRRISLKPGQTSPVLFQTGEGRFVDEIALSFRVSRSGRGSRSVELSGLQTADDRAARREAALAQAGAETPVPAPAPAGENVQTAVLPPAPAPVAIRDSEPPVPSRPVRSATSPAGDVLLGARSIEPGAERGVIEVPERIGRYSQLRLRALDSAVFVRSAEVVYADGRSGKFDISYSLKPEEESDWIEIDGTAFVKKIMIDIDRAQSGAGTPRLEVFGAHADGWLGAEGEGKAFNDGWVLLAAQTAGFLGFDTDEIVVGDNEAGLKQLKVSVRDRAVTLDRIKVVYRDGGEKVVAVASKITAGESYGPIALESDKKGVAKIEARYRSRFADSSANGNDSAIVEIWAKH